MAKQILQELTDRGVDTDKIIIAIRTGNADPNSSQINLSALKGEGKVTALELNCAVPTIIRIQWTKLKTVHTQLCLDEIRVTIETCEELRAG